MSSTHTGIAWTEATWNPVTGCSHVSDGCKNCYAESLARRFDKTALPWTAPNAAANVRFHERRLLEPLTWRKPRRVFVNSMSDLFHEQLTDQQIDQVFAVMANAWHHTFQVLTKRPQRMRAYFRGIVENLGERIAEASFAVTRDDDVACATANYVNGWTFGKGTSPHRNAEHGKLRWPLPNVWLGVSAENLRASEERIPLLLDTPAALRFVSAEPLLGPVYLPAGVDWVIVGGESGPNHRPMNLDHLVDVVAQADSLEIPVFVKQDSGRFPGKQGRISDTLWRQEFPCNEPEGDT